MDTIVALATPIGRSGIGVIRLSGDRALEITRRLARDDEYSPEPRQTTLKKIYDIESGEVIGDVIDQALITYFKTPHSFTGEDVIEISCHGSPVLLRQIIDICLKLDARMADPGEFTLRALANSRMNLSQAEAVRDLIDAQTRASARQAMRQLRGELSNELQPLKDALLESIVVLESALEFVEDDLPEVQAENVKQRLSAVADGVGAMADTFRAGKLLREGLKIALVGRPNVGKSSLFNALLGQDRAIVTEIAGTTRDQLHEKFTIENIPISLIDTAGLRETADTVESIGVERSKRTIADADLVIVVLDGSQELTLEDIDIIKSEAEQNKIVLVNKIDLISAEGTKQATEKIQSATKNSQLTIVEVSAKTGAGLDELERAMIEPFSLDNMGDSTGESGFLVSDARHHDLLLRAKTEIENSIDLMEQKTSEEITLVGLHNALRYLGEITGETTTEDMLTRIFSTFCIGK
ncbi:MAG TPA: tRNA uridine-5-carboxymethylaminomethyl(34) synthesis GTPase MnmE [Pyrinomonadaceae bacterium]|jgi:tRNA modification GTPase|nr:tRNA uridine-5-carboxymethylaminomethyl(34) synthesis GTPase MnmE [Pyrinomonadaceae bacterium]